MLAGRRQAATSFPWAPETLLGSRVYLFAYIWSYRSTKGIISACSVHQKSTNSSINSYNAVYNCDGTMMK
jgi:hypothetical protein